jgi:hypothetical protein
MTYSTPIAKRAVVEVPRATPRATFPDIVIDIGFEIWHDQWQYAANQIVRYFNTESVAWMPAV